LLIYDGHRSHETLELREAADKAGIHLFCLPPHTSHRLQPLDVGVFGPLQQAWQKRCLMFLEKTRRSITRQNVVEEYLAARTQSITEGLILSAWRHSGIRPLDPNVFTEEHFAPSYASSTNPPLPVSFPGPTNDLDSPQDEAPDQPSGDECEGSGRSENAGVASRALVDANMGPSSSRGSLSMLNQIAPPNREVPYDFPLSAPSTPTLSPQSNETGHVLREEGRRDPLPPPSQPRAARDDPACTPSSLILPDIINVPRRQTRSVSRQLSRSSSATQVVSPEYVTILEARLQDANKRNQELESSAAEWRTHCHFMCGLVTQLQSQLQAKEKKRGVHAKKIQVEARVLTSEEGRLEMQQLREEARLKEQRQLEDAARKDAEDDARRKRRADGSRIFAGPLNKTRRKEDLEDIAAALALPDGGKKDDLLDRIIKHFDEHADLKTNSRFEGLFNPRPRKRARLAETSGPVAGPGGPSNFHESSVPPFTTSAPPSSSTLVPPATSHDTLSTSISPYYFNAFYFTPQQAPQ
jgi:hypothetical protein